VFLAGWKNWFRKAKEKIRELKVGKNKKTREERRRKGKNSGKEKSGKSKTEKIKRGIQNRFQGAGERFWNAVFDASK